MTVRRFAEDTRVPTDRTRQQIEAMLRTAKAERIVHMDEAGELIVAFVMKPRWIKIVVRDRS